MKITHLAELHSFINQYSFATLVSHHEAELHVSHIPITLQRKDNTNGTLIWHLAKQNPHSAALSSGSKTVCIFHGPHAYISPKWYKSSPNVPTWNYATVHAHGIPKQVSCEQLANDLTQMVKQYEGDADYLIPDDYKQKLMKHIIGFEMAIEKIEGIFKLGQNRSKEDQEGMMEGLGKEGEKIVELMLRHE